MSETTERPRAHRSAIVATVFAVALLLGILIAGPMFFAGPGFLFAILGIATLGLLPILIIVGILLFVFRPLLDRDHPETVQVRCRSCEGLNPEGARFCSACGNPV